MQKIRLGGIKEFTFLPNPHGTDFHDDYYWSEQTRLLHGRNILIGFGK